jgi:hypothetical protein
VESVAFYFLKETLPSYAEKLFGCLSLRLMGWHTASNIQHRAAGLLVIFHAPDFVGSFFLSDW